MEMGMPQVTDEHRRLSFLTGTWAGEETLQPSPWDPHGGKATGRIESRTDLDGFFVVADYTQDRGGQCNYRGHGVYGYDPMEKCYTLHWFDSFGMAPASPARGQFTGDTLTFENRTPMGYGRYVYVLKGDGRYAFRMETSQDGRQWMTFMDAEYRRV